MTILEKVESFCHHEGLLKEGQTVIVACSGGPDSMTLLHILGALKKSYNLQLIVAYVHHGLRAAAAAELKFVEAAAVKQNAVFCSTYADVKALAEAEGLSVEAAGREVRYAFFADLAGKYGSSAVAVGHHADDQVETVLLHLIRGGGTGGATGMQSKNGHIIRPLLCLTRQEILSYIEENHLSCCFDESNASREYLRNRIRLDVVPLLRSYNPGIAAAFGRFAEIAGSEDDCLTVQTERLFKELVCLDDVYRLAVAKAARLHKALQRRLVRRICAAVKGNDKDLTFDFTEKVLALMRKQSGRQVRMKEITVYRSGAYLCFTGPGGRDEPVGTALPGNVGVTGTGTYELNGWKLTVQKVLTDGYTLSANEFFLAADPAEKPLTLRYRRGGETINIGGAYHKTLKKYLIEKKIPAERRGHIPLLCDGDTVLWLCGCSADITRPLALKKGPLVCTVSGGDDHA